MASPDNRNMPLVLIAAFTCLQAAELGVDLLLELLSANESALQMEEFN